MVDGRIVSSLVAALLLAACATPSSRREGELKELAAWLPGTYDNLAQAQADERQGVRPPHDKVAVAIVRIVAPTVGDHVFYMQEMAADDPRRVMSQRVLTFAATSDGIVQTLWWLKEPLHWRDGYLNPEMFESLVPQDLRVVRGCALNWKKTGERFVGANDPARCRQSSSAGEEPVQLQIREELGPDELALAELAFDAGGRLVRGRQDEPFNRFRKESR